MKEEVVTFFKSTYEDPVIEMIDKTSSLMLPGLTFYRVFERKQLVQDPLIPDLWIMNSKKIFFRSTEMDKAMESENISPSSESEALYYSKALVMNKFRAFYSVNEDKSFSNIIPDEFFNEKYYPKISMENGKYSISVFFYFPDSRFTAFNLLYKKQLVEFCIEIDGCNYSVKKTCIINQKQ